MALIAVGDPGVPVTGSPIFPRVSFYYQWRLRGRGAGRLFVKTSTSVALLCGVLLAPVNIHAQPAQPLDPIIVTASRTPTPIDRVIGSAQVITRADIERLQPRDVLDLLHGQPGLAVARNGGRGQVSSVFVRGNESRQTLVLINGRRAGTVELPGFSWEYVPVAQIERIEIVPGARSSLYGSQAFGGVINIITRQDSATSVRAGGGNLGSHDLDAHSGWRNETFDLGVGAGLERTSGYDVTTPANFSADPDEDGYDAHHVGVHAGVNLSKAARLELDVLHNQGVTEFDSVFNNFRIDQHRLGLNIELAERTALQLDAGYNRDQRYYDPSFFGFFSDSERRSASAQVTHSYSGGSSVIGGVDYSQDRFRSSGDENTQRISRAVFANALPQFGALSLEAGARYERDNAYGDISTGQLGARYAFTPQSSVFARAGNAFRAPTFQERFGGAFNIASPSLQPERATSVEVGHAREFAGIKGNLSLYQNRVRDLISFNASGADGMPFNGDEFYENVQRTRMRGAELTLAARCFEIDLNAGLAYLDARNEATDAPLARRPHKTARLDADRRWNAFGFGASLVVEGSRPDGGATLGGFGLLHLRASWAQTPWLSWELSGHNVLDRDYTTVATYRAEPATVRLGLVWRPQAQ